MKGTGLHAWYNKTLDQMSDDECEKCLKYLEHAVSRYMEYKMKIEVHLLSRSEPIKYDNVQNAYTKGSLFCVYKDDLVYKYPFCNIFRVIEEY